ncbi:family with sequence similarity 151 member b [Plakobranchus ocellatus]|uniref:Family with sequence similarity 151 member b n=1 Tax=Plakobranchus ocellatus TaxID=259542 RepID=A0AAV4BG13_9GAST|nr:family with sequence similarity 151 member b [Plakobranchus ocellatus]
MANRRDPLLFLPPMPRSYKKHIAFQIIGAAVVIFIWYNLNGGFIPKFLVPRMPFFQIGPDIGCLIFFNVESDASKIRWARAANSQKAVTKAMKDPDIHMVSGDVILRGHGTKSQTLEPVMATPSQLDSDITLRDWLQATGFGNKGIKIHLHSMESVEISLQILKEFHEQNTIKFPVWIHADVLQGPHGDEPVIDYERFYQILMRLFPKCTLSLGWTTGTHTDLSQSAYTWEMVWDMLDLIQKHEDKLSDHLLVFQARLSLIHNSVPQLKWLTDNTHHSSLMIWHEKDDIVANEDVMYVAYRFPPDHVYYDLNHERLQTLLSQYRHFSRDKVQDLVLKRDEVMFKPQGWLKMGFHRQKNSILASTEAIILVNPIVHIVSKSTYLPTEEIYIQGRVTFFNRKNREPELHHTGLNIYVRPSQYTIYDKIVGIRCFIGASGELEVTGSNLPPKIPSFRKTARLTTTLANCYRFRITDERTHLSFAVKAQHDCTTLESVEPEDDLVALIRVELPKGLESDKQHPFVLRTEDNNREALIDELSIKHKV